jgi:hypothetical protein
VPSKGEEETDPSKITPLHASGGEVEFSTASVGEGARFPHLQPMCRVKVDTLQNRRIWGLLLSFGILPMSPEGECRTILGASVSPKCEEGEGSPEELSAMSVGDGARSPHLQAVYGE